jgi:hypothetical protein
MKQLYTLLLMLPAMLLAQTEIDFQSLSSGLPGTSWTWTADVENTSFAVVDNPDATGINTSSKVGELTAAAGSNAWALAFSDGIGSFSFDNTNTTVKIMVYKTRISPVEIKFEDAADNTINVSRTVPNTVINAWEELTFDFYSAIGNTLYSKIVIIPDNTTRTEANVTYFDNITFTTGVETAAPTIALPVDFEEAVDAYDVTGFDGGVASIEAGPDGANSLKYIKGAGQNWAGVKITLDTAVDGANGEVITASVHSTVARDITLKFDVANKERKVSHGGTGWEAMSFDFTGDMPANQTVIAFFNDLTQQGDGSADWTIYIDNLAQTTGGTAGPTIALPVDFEKAADAYDVTGFDGGVATVEAGPDGANSLKYVKGAGQNWAGVKITLDTAVDGANGEVITANVHSTVARDITLKFDVANKERKVSHGGTGWEAMSFDFTGDMPANQTVIAFFNDLTQQGDGSADWTIYIDDLAQPEPPIALPVDFEKAADAYDVTGFDGGVATVEAGPDGANSLKYVKGAGQNWAGVKITLDTAVDGANGEVITANVHSTVARDITLKFDVANKERKVSHGGTGWEAMSFDFTGDMPANQTVIAFFNDLTQQGDGSADWTIYIDNLAQTTGGNAGPTIALPVDFEKAADAYDVTGFDGGVATVEAGPDGANSLKYVKGAGQNWAGVKITLDTAVDGANGEVITANVHSTVARDITLKFDVANKERKVSHGGTGWEAMSFDFTGDMPANQTVIAFFNDLTQQGDGSADWTIYIDDLAQPEPPIALPVDFEKAADAYDVTGFDGGVATVEAGPDGANSLKYVKGAGQNWAGVKITLDTAVDGANGEVITANVHSTVARDITLKFDVANKERKVSHGGTGWEAMSFDFTGDMPANQTVIAFFNDLTQQGDGSADWTIYIDNLAQTVAGPATAPPPPPTRNSWDVISVYGEAYGADVGLGAKIEGSSDFADETIAGEVVLKTELADGDFIGANLVSKIDATEMTHFHIDYWIAGELLVGQTMNTKWIDYAGGTTEATFFQDYNSGPEAGSWKSRDIEISQLNGGSTRSDLAEFVLTFAAAFSAKPDKVYIDNVYFYRAATASINDLKSNVNVYPNPVENTLNVSAGDVVDSVTIFDLTGREVLRATPNAAAFSLDVSNLNKGLYLVTVKAGKQELNTKLVK